MKVGSFATIFAAVFTAAAAAAPVVHVDTGKVLVWQQSAGDWVVAQDSVTVGSGDSLFCDIGNGATLRLAAGCEVLLRAPCRVAVSVDSPALRITLVQGEVFLKREWSEQAVVISAKGCSFTPVGTAAAVKFTKLGEPTTAVLRGSVSMKAPDGAAITVGPRSFGTFDANGTFKQGTLPENAVKSLEAWSGVQAEPAPQAQTTAPSAATPPPASVTPPPAAPVVAAPAAPTSSPATTSAEPAKPAGQSPASTTASAEKAKTDQPAKKPAASTTAAEASKPATKSEEKKAPEENPADAAKDGSKDAPKDAKKPADKAEGKPTWGLGAGPVTVGSEQWTRVIFSGDIPVWKFGVGVDVEVFLNADGQFDKKGWDFSEDAWLESVLRKIRYLRFGYEKDPLFVKVGGLDNVTLSYGFIMDRFTNMLHYPDQKLLGLQFYLNNLTPLGLTLQTVVPDFLDLRNDGGVLGARFALKPLKMTEIPIVKGIDVGIVGAYDRNQFAPARAWDYSLRGSRWDRDQDRVTDSTFYFDRFGTDPFYDSLRAAASAEEDFDTVIENRDAWAKRAIDRFSEAGFDITVPLIAGTFLGLDVYGQYAMSIDNENDYEMMGWGIGAPGVGLRVGPVQARVEYRHTDGRITPGHFGPYYFDERLRKFALTDSTDTILTKEQTIVDESLNGVYGMLSFNIKNILLISGSYQYLIGDREALDHRFEAAAGLGDLLISKIPKLKKLEGYLTKTDIGRSVNPVTGDEDRFFTPTPSMYYGYRLGFEIIQGAMLVWDARYGFAYDLRDKEGRAEQTVSNVSIQATLTF